MPRLVYLSGVGVVLVAAAFLLTDRLLYCPGVTEANFRRLREGMTFEQVNTLFGAPGIRDTNAALYQAAYTWRSQAGDYVWLSFGFPPRPCDAALVVLLRSRATNS